MDTRENQKAADKILTSKVTTKVDTLNKSTLNFFSPELLRTASSGLTAPVACAHRPARDAAGSTVRKQGNCNTVRDQHEDDDVSAVVPESATVTASCTLSQLTATAHHGARQPRTPTAQA